MPCYDSRDDDDRIKTRQDLDERTAMLCEAMKLLEELGITNRCGARLRHWWSTHKEFDRKRKRHEGCKAKKGLCTNCRKRSYTHIFRASLCCRCYDLVKGIE